MIFFLLTLTMTSISDVDGGDVAVDVTMRFPTLYESFEDCTRAGLEYVAEFSTQGADVSISCDQGVNPDAG